MGRRSRRWRRTGWALLAFAVAVVVAVSEAESSQTEWSLRPTSPMQSNAMQTDTDRPVQTRPDRQTDRQTDKT